MTKNYQLKKKIIECDTTQRAICKQVGIPEAMLSHAISGRWNLSPVEKAKIAEVLGCDSREIFGA